MNPELTISLRTERGESLLHGLELLRQSWRDFDVARGHQPPISPRTVDLTLGGLPQVGTGVTAALDAAAAVLDESLAQSRPRFFGYVGSSGLESAVLADAMAVSHDVNLAAESGAAVLVEQQALRWVGELVGYPARAGTFTSGGMLSNLTALMAARTRALPESRMHGTAGVRATVYASAEAHSSVERAVEILGLGRESLRPIPIDDRRRMDVSELEAAIQRDRRQGRTPIAVVATAGTTLTGAVDPLCDVADVSSVHGLWMHVDGAYGLPAACSPATSDLFAGLERADSASVDAHKWLFVPKACGVLMLREPGPLRDAFVHDSAYMLDDEVDPHPVDSTLEYSRPFRALKLWVALMAHGASAFASAITANVDLARQLQTLVSDHPRMEPLLDAPDLSIVPFRRLPSHGDIDQHNLQLAKALQMDGRVFVTSAIVDGRACLRPCIVNFRTTLSDVEELVLVADEVGARLERNH